MSSVVKRPRPHQLEAIEAVQATLADQDRASVLMACDVFPIQCMVLHGSKLPSSREPCRSA